MVKTVGTKNNVATVAKARPPMTARPSGAFCSPPSPRPSAIGIMPMIMASAVISTGRNRVTPASMAASRAQPLPRERDHQDAVRGPHPHAHDRPHQGGHAQGGVGEEEEHDDPGEG